MGKRDILERVVRCTLRTSMANAFRRAFGLPQAWDAPSGALTVSCDRYADMRECFANHASPMDGR